MKIQGIWTMKQNMKRMHSNLCSLCAFVLVSVSICKSSIAVLIISTPATLFSGLGG